MVARMTVNATSKEHLVQRAGDGPAFADSDYRDQADFRIALREFLHRSELHAQEAGMTDQQYLVLLVVRGHRKYPKVTIGDVARALHVRHHAASALVDRCVKQGLLDRVE